jgi:thymidylate synthase
VNEIELENGSRILGTDGHGNVEQQPEIDQVKLLIEAIKKNPNGRRHIVTAWNPTYLSEMGLPPCHRDFQCYVSNDGHLDLMMAIRSWDTALGGPFNIAQYALLTHLIARATGLKARHLKINYGDAHLYLNHVEKIHDVITLHKPIECDTQLVINTDNTDIDGYKPSDFDITGYECHSFVKLPIAV